MNTIMPREYGFFALGRSNFSRCCRGVGDGFTSLGGSGMCWLYIFRPFLWFSFSWTQQFHQLPVINRLTLSSPVVSNGYTSKCSQPYWSNPPILIFWHPGTLVLRTERWVPECQKIKRVGQTSMALNALVDSFLPQSEKVWDWKV